MPDNNPSIHHAGPHLPITTGEGTLCDSVAISWSGNDLHTETAPATQERRGGGDRSSPSAGTDESWFILVKDDDAHPYVIPQERKDDWDAFLEMADTQWTTLPDWAVPVTGRLRFRDYQV